MENNEIHTRLRLNPVKRHDKVLIGCGAGFGGDRPLAALKLLKSVPDLNYLVLECLAERTLADRYQIMAAGGDGYDSRISEWMNLLLPLAVEKGTCIITNMGAIDPPGAQEKVLEIANDLGLKLSVAVACEVFFTESDRGSSCTDAQNIEGGLSTYLGAAPIVECLEKYQPNVIITSRVADAALFLAPMVYELGWNWNDLEQLAQGTLAGHLLECGCQLTGGYFMHPGDKYRDMPLSRLLDLSLPYAEISYDGEVVVAKAEGSRGVLNFSTCAEQLLYEVGDPGAYITPDVIIDVRDVTFTPLSSCKVLCTGAKPSTKSAPEKLLQLVPEDCGWKGWGEISYGGFECVQRAKIAEFLVRSWLEEVNPGANKHILSYVIGLNSLKAINTDNMTLSCKEYKDIRLRMDGLFELKKSAVQFNKEFTALYTNGPAGGGGISTGVKKEIILQKNLVSRESVFWQTQVKHTNPVISSHLLLVTEVDTVKIRNLPEHVLDSTELSAEVLVSPALSGEIIPLYVVAHSRAGDKGNDSNFSIIPHFPPDIERLKLVITPQWVKSVVSTLLTSTYHNVNTISQERVDEDVRVEVYEVKGICSLNVVVRNILDGGVNCSRRMDRHGKTISDLILSQQVVLP